MRGRGKNIRVGVRAANAAQHRSWRLMLDVEAHLHTMLAALGTKQLIPSTEESTESVWVTEDQAPGGRAGYYEKRHVAPPYRLIKDGCTVALDIELDQIPYRIRCSNESTREENIERVADIFSTLVNWIADGIVTPEKAFLPFARPPKNNKWWQILRAPPDATREEIEAAYRRQARIVHPDAGGSDAAFRELRSALEEARRYLREPK